MRRAGDVRRRREGRALSDDRYPADLLYTAEHEWLRVSLTSEGALVRLGITHYAQEALGDIVFVTLPAIGMVLETGQPLGEVESTKSVSDVYAAVPGTVGARNDALDANPELVNSDPYGEGWLLEIQVTEADRERALGGLLDAEAYQALLT